MSVYECGVFLIADVKIWRALTSSSGLVVSGSLQRKGERRTHSFQHSF